MLSVTVNTNASNLTAYFLRPDRADSDAALLRRELDGVWGGKGADLLGLSGPVRPDDFDGLAHNLRPEPPPPAPQPEGVAFGELRFAHPRPVEQRLADEDGRLTPRDREGRRCAMTLVFSPHKSFSVYHALSGDERVPRWVRKAAVDAAGELEKLAAARQRAGGATTRVTTGNLVFASFLHFTARPEGGVPDPQLHAHVVCFNATHVAEENRWLALEPYDMARAYPLAEAIFHHRLAELAQADGLRTEPRGGYAALAHVGPELCALFSRRTDAIARFVRDRGLRDPRAKARAGARTREDKGAARDPAELAAEWRSRVTPEELRRVASPPPPDRDAERGRAAMARAVEEAFDRSGVLPLRSVVERALRAAPGALPLPAAEALVRTLVVTRPTPSGEVATTRAAAERDRGLLAAVRRGQGRCEAPPRAIEGTPGGLPPEAAIQVQRALASPDRVTLLDVGRAPGGAGAVLAAVAALAPPAESVVLVARGAPAGRPVLDSAVALGAPADTPMLTARALRAATPTPGPRIYFVQDAQRLPVDDVRAVIDAAEARGGKVLLAFDPAKRSSPRGGNPVATLLRHAQLTPVRVEPGPDRSAMERAADAFGSGAPAEGLETLRSAGRVRVDHRHRLFEAAVDAALEQAGPRRRVVVATRTRTEARFVGWLLRHALVERGLVRRGRQVRRLVEVDRPFGGLYRPSSIQPGQRVRFFRARATIKAGSSWTILARLGRRALLAGRDGVRLVNLAKPDGLVVYNRVNDRLARGETIRLTRGARVRSVLREQLGRVLPIDEYKRHELKAGTEHTVAALRRDGSIVLKGGHILPPGWGLWEHVHARSADDLPKRGCDHVVVLDHGGRREHLAKLLHTAALAARDGLTLVTESVAAAKRDLAAPDPDAQPLDVADPALRQDRDHAAEAAALEADRARWAWAQRRAAEEEDRRARAHDRRGPERERDR